MTWDNGDRTVLVNPNLGGITLGWNLQHTAQDELFAAIEGTAFHTRVILDRMSEYGRAHAEGDQRRRHSAEQSGAQPGLRECAGKAGAVPASKVTGIGSAVFAFLAAGTFKSIGEAQERICPAHKVYEPEPAAQKCMRACTSIIARSILPSAMREKASLARCCRH